MISSSFLRFTAQLHVGEGRFFLETDSAKQA